MEMLERTQLTLIDHVQWYRTARCPVGAKRFVIQVPPSKRNPEWRNTTVKCKVPDFMFSSPLPCGSSEPGVELDSHGFVRESDSQQFARHSREQAAEPVSEHDEQR